MAGLGSLGAMDGFEGEVCGVEVEVEGTDEEVSGFSIGRDGSFGLIHFWAKRG